MSEPIPPTTPPAAETKAEPAPGFLSPVTPLLMDESARALKAGDDRAGREFLKLALFTERQAMMKLNQPLIDDTRRVIQLTDYETRLRQTGKIEAAKRVAELLQQIGTTPKRPLLLQTR